MDSPSTTTSQLHKPHMVLIPYPAQGHISPFIFLARKLAEHGFIITVVNIDSLHKVVSSQWTSRRQPGAIDIRFEQIPCEISMPQGLSASDVKKGSSFASAVDNTEAPARELLSRLSPPPSCLVFSYFLSWGIKLAKDMNLHPISYWSGNAAWCSLHKHLDLLVSHGDAFQDDTEDAERSISYIPGFRHLSYADLPDYLRSKPDDVNKFLDRWSRRLDKSEWILVNSLSELEPDVFHDMQQSLPNLVPIGPLLQLSGDVSPSGGSLREEDYECLKWLDTQAESSVLYISFGSIGTLSERAFEELAAGLEASRQAFLWVVRGDLVDVERKEEKYREFVERSRKQGMVVSWAPQVKVLSHSSVGGFLSHCGWNSTLESICHGVPVLGWPIFADQHLNCKLISEDWRFGKRLSRQREVSREAVEESIRDFMQGEDMEEIRARVTSFKDVACKTVRRGGNSYTNFQKLVHAMQKV